MASTTAQKRSERSSRASRRPRRRRPRTAWPAGSGGRPARPAGRHPSVMEAGKAAKKRAPAEEAPRQPLGRGHVVGAGVGWLAELVEVARRLPGLEPHEEEEARGEER